MALYNEILTGRHNRFIQKLFGMKGAAPTPQLSSEIGISHPIFHGVENRFLESWNRYANRGNPAAGGAGLRSGFRLRNPPTSNVIAVIEKALVANVSGAAMQIGIGLGGVFVDLATVFNSRSVDARNTITGVSSVLIASQDVNVVGTASQIGNIILPISTSQDFVLTEDHELTLLPGWAFDIFGTTLNAAIDCSVIWRERALEESERQ